MDFVCLECLLKWKFLNDDYFFGILVYVINCNVLWYLVFCINWYCFFLFYNYNICVFCSYFDWYKIIIEIKEKIIYKFSVWYIVLECLSWGCFMNNKWYEVLFKCCLWIIYILVWYWFVWIINKFYVFRLRLIELCIF